MDLRKAREAAYQLAQEEAYAEAIRNQRFKKTEFSKYSPIYLTATSNVKGLLSLYKDYESVLTVGSTGALGFEAAINGAKKVDMFDINKLQKIYYELLKTAITYLDYEEFIHYFSHEKLPKQFRKRDINNLVSTEMYEKIKDFLPSEARFVLEPLYENFYSADLLLSGLYHFKHTIDIDYLKSVISFYNKEEYTKLQNILKNNECDINYHNVDLTDVPDFFKDKYDLILLDNILQYYKDIPMLDTPDKVHQFVSQKLNERVNDYGLIQVNYGFEVTTLAFQQKFGIPFDNPNQDFGIPNFKIMEEMENGINIQLYEKWRNQYKYDLIPGVMEPKSKIKNMVITYQKK